MNRRLLLGALLLSIAAIPAFTNAQCAGAHLATPEEAASASSGGIIAGVTMVCPGDARLGVSNQVGEAKKYLLSISEGLQGTQAPPTADRINNLNNTLAVCAANFLKAYTQTTGVQMKLRSAFRCGPNTPQGVQCDRTENARAGGAGGSNHQLGLAIDVNPLDGNYPKLWQFASQNPSFGVCFPYLGGDRPHMTLAGSGTGEAAKCAAQGVTNACSGAPIFDARMPTGTGNVTIGTGGLPAHGATMGGGIGRGFASQNNPLSNLLNPTIGLIAPLVMTSLLSPQSEPPPPPPMQTIPTAYPYSSYNPAQSAGPTTTFVYVPYATAPGPAVLDQLSQIVGTPQDIASPVTVIQSASGTAVLNSNLFEPRATATNVSSISYRDDILSSTSVPVAPIHVDDTFAPARADEARDLRGTYDPSLLLRALQALRELLATMVVRVHAGVDHGFYAAWQIERRVD